MNEYIWWNVSHANMIFIYIFIYIFTTYENFSDKQ